ncbi:DUF1203 domain-containing protein [Aliivibrio kagoshimensis]|uniref:DUF1203 domain-containing protein n=1 Tax=Aliivibrio kagoshimensis TaxID=2910230 RepID=UPI003D098376
MAYKVLTIDSDFLKKVRDLGIDDLDQPVEYLTAEGGEPCRDVLRRAEKGEKLILASYCPFKQAGPYREYGPVFVLLHPESSEYDASKLPLPTGSSTDYLASCFVVKAYCGNERIVDAKLSSPEAMIADLDAFFSASAVEFVIVRFAAYGCYSFRVQR